MPFSGGFWSSVGISGFADEDEFANGKIERVNSLKIEVVLAILEEAIAD